MAEQEQERTFYRVVAKQFGWLRTTYSIGTVVLREQKNRWIVVSGKEHVEHRKIILKRERRFRLKDTPEEAQLHLLQELADDMARVQRGIEWDQERLAEIHQLYQKTRTEHSIDVDPWPLVSEIDTLERRVWVLQRDRERAPTEEIIAGRDPREPDEAAELVARIRRLRGELAALLVPGGAA